MRYRGRHRPGEHAPRSEHTADLVLRDRIICRCGAVTMREKWSQSERASGYFETLIKLFPDDSTRRLLWRAHHK